MRTTKYKELLILLNKVWGLEGCPLKGQLVRTNRRGRFVFGGSTVLVASNGDQVSFNTTVGDGGFQFVKGNRVDMSHGIWRGA